MCCAVAPVNLELSHGLVVGLAACSVVVCVCVSRPVGGTGSMQRSGVCVSRPVGGTGSMQRSGVCVCHGLLVGLATCSIVVCACAESCQN